RRAPGAVVEELVVPERDETLHRQALAQVLRREPAGVAGVDEAPDHVQQHGSGPADRACGELGGHRLVDGEEVPRELVGQRLASSPQRRGRRTTVTKKSSIWRTTSMNREKSTGLVTYAFACSEYDRSTSSSASLVVSTTTGMCRRSASDFIAVRTSRPSIRGRLRSSRTRS